VDEEESALAAGGRFFAALMRVPFEGPIPLVFPSRSGRIAARAINVGVGTRALQRFGVPLREAVLTSALADVGTTSLADSAEEAWLRNFGLGR